MKKYLIYLAQSHPGFRKAELESIAELNGVEVDLSSHDESNPFMIVYLKSDEDARKLVARAVLARGIYELLGKGRTMDELHANVKQNAPPLLEPYMDSTFKFSILQYQGRRRSKKDQIKMMDSFKYLELRGKVSLEHPDQVYTILEWFSLEDNQLRPKQEPDYRWFGRLIQMSARSDGIVDVYNIAKRPYFGTTTFESELSLVTCNLAQVKPGSLVYDPFVGTGSFLLGSSYFGGYTFGSDIDWLALKGGNPRKSKGKRLIDDFKYYGTEQRFVDVICMDFIHCSLRKDLKFDTIVCDPPYGIREGVRVCGTNDLASAKLTMNKVIGGQKAYLRKDYIQPKKTCSLDFMLDDLLQFASERLPVGGRLCFWMPASNDADVPTLIPKHERLELIYVLVQHFNKWSRRLLVYVKRDSSYKGETVTAKDRKHENNFRERYFSGFAKQK